MVFLASEAPEHNGNGSYPYMSSIYGPECSQGEVTVFHAHTYMVGAGIVHICMRYGPSVHTPEVWPQGTTYTRGIAPGHNNT